MAPTPASHLRAQRPRELDRGPQVYVEGVIYLLRAEVEKGARTGQSGVRDQDVTVVARRGELVELIPVAQIADNYLAACARRHRFELGLVTAGQPKGGSPAMETFGDRGTDSAGGSGDQCGCAPDLHVRSLARPAR